MPDSINVAEVQWDKPDDKIDTGAIKWDKPEEKPTYQPSESINDESLIKSTDQSQGKPSSFFDSLQKARQLDNVDGNKAFIALKNAELLGVDPSYAYINHDVVNEQVTNKLTDEKESDPNLAKIKAPGYFDIATDMVKKAASYLISGDTDLFTPRPNARHDLMNHYEDDGSSLSSYTKAQNEKEEEWFRESRAEQANMRIKAIISQPESSSIFVEYFKKPIIQDYNMLGQVVNSAALPVALIIQEMTGSDEPIKILEDGIEKFRIQQKIAEFDPKTSFAGSVVKNLIKIAPFMLIPGAKEIFTAGATLESGYSAAESGVDATTAIELGIASGVGTYGMLSIPLWAKNIWARVAAATTVFPLAGMAERKAEKGILSANDYKELSEQVKVFDKRTLASDLAMNIIFGLMAKEPPRSPRDTINALKVLQKLSDKNLKVEDRHASFNAASNVFNGEVPDAAQFGYHTDQLLNLNKDYQDRIHVRTALQDIYARFGIKPDEASANIKKLAGDNPTPESLSDAIDTYKTSLQEKTALRPAITVGGQELIGNVGDSHTDILRSNNLYEGEDDERYFVDPQGNKLTRLQARDYVKENDPSAYREWVAINGNGEKGEFHSRDYAEAADIDHKDPNKLSDKPVWSMTPEEVSDHQDNINREYGRLAGNAKDDEANLGPDHEQSQRSAKALEDFERQHPEWIGGNPEDAKATHEAYIKWAIDNDKDVTPEMVAPYPDRVKQFEQTAKGRLAMAEYNVRKLAKDNGIKINKIEAEDLWHEFVRAAQAQGIDLSKYGDTLESQAANLEKRLADGNSIPELGVIKTESATDSILKIVEANPKRFTIDISNGKQFSGKGYIVSPSKRTATVVNKITAGNINSFLEKFKAVFDSDKRTFLGGWFCDDKASPDFGKYVFDVSFVVDNYADSVYIADIGKQDGIFYQKGLDHAENRYIPTSEGIEDLKKSGVYDESRRSELGGLQESLHRLIPDEGDVDRGTDTGTASVPESAEGLVRPAESNASEQRPESVPDYSIRRKINLPEDGRKRVKEELAKNPSAGAIKQFKDKPAILTHWSNQDNLTQTDPTKHGTGFAGAEMKSKQAYPELFLPRTYAGYGNYQREWGLGGNRYKIRVPGNRLYDAWEDPLKIYPSMEEVEKMGYHDAAAQRLIYENRIKDAGFAGFVSSKFGAAAIFEPMKVEAVKPGQKSLRQEPVRMNEPQYSIKQKMDDETHRKAVETGDEKTAQKMVDEKAKEVGWDKDVLPSTFDDFGNIVPLSKMFDPLPDTRYSIRQKDKTATDETQPKPATPKPEFKPKEDKPERFSILKEKTPVPAKDSEGNLVGVKKAVQVEEREQRGMPQFESPGTKSDKEHQQAAADLLEVIPGYGQRFVANLLENPRALTKEEVPILSLYKADLLSQEKTILAAKQDARERGATKQEMSKLEDEHNSLKSNIEKTILAGDMSGYEASIGFNARKQMVRDDYSAVRMEMRSKDAGKGKDLTPEEKKKIEETVLKLYKASDATSEHLKEKAAKYDADQAIDKIKREIAAAERKAKRTATKEDIYAQRNAILASIRERTKSSAATPHVGIDPEIASDLVKLAKTYVMEGITDVAQLVDNIHENVKDMIEGVTPRDIRDAITGYGKEKKEVTKDALTLAINEAKKQMKLISQIEDAEKGIEPAKSGKVKQPDSPEVAKLKSDLLEAMKKSGLIEEKEEKLPKTPEEINAQRLAAWKKRVTARIEDMEGRMESGDYEKPKKERVPIALDKEGMDLKEREDRIKNELEDLVEKKRQANMSAPEKLKDMILKVRRFSLLSRVVIFGKLGIAAISRFGLTPLETGVGTIIQLAPWVKTIAEQAHREGATFKGSQEAAALRQVWEKGTWEDVPKLWKTGLGQLDVLHGNKAYSGTPELLNSMGRLHSICKIIPKRAEYYRSFEIIADWYHKNGYDLKDPSVIARIGAESYIEANRAIFMNDNFEVRWFRTLIGKMENVKPSEGGSEVAPIGGKLLSLGLETEFPIIKVASNFANETASYNAGGVGAIARLVARSKTFGGKGYKNLSNEDANFIMRNLKKNSVGLLLASAVFSGLVKVTFGGLYQKEEKRDPNALGPGEIAINGKKLPKLGSYFLTHIPIVLALQVFQTMVNAYDAERLKGEGLISRTVGAAGAGASALASNVPFVGSTDRDLPSLFTSKGREKYIESLVVSFLPTFDADKVAKVMDKDRPTKPENIGQQFENIIPGMRENVPTNERTVKREIIAAKRAGQPLNEYQQDYYNKLDYDDKHKLTKEAKMTFNQATFKNETLSNQIKTWDQLKDEEKLQVGQLLINKYNSLVDRDIHKSRQFKDDVRRIKSEYKELKSGGNYQKPPSVSEEPAEESDEKGESLE
jgi:hypothetical protein